VPNDNLKWAVVTGASRGIGQATAFALSDQEYGVLLLARSQDDLRQTVSGIREQGGKAHYLSVDLSNPAEIVDSQGFFAPFAGKIKLVVHNAGIAKVGRIRDMNLDDWQTVQDVNVRAPFLLTRQLLPLMAQNSQFVFINSIAGKQSFAEWGAYCASKYALKALADTLRAELAPEGIRVTSIFPSAVDTPLQDQLPYDWDRNKMMRTDDVVRAIVFCAGQPAKMSINELYLEDSAGTF